MMVFFSRFSRKVEEVNNGKADPKKLFELFDELDMNEFEGEETWHNMQPNIVTNVVKAVENSVERAFVFVDLSGDATIETFFQIDGKSVLWNQLPNKTYVDNIQNQLMVQAQDIADYINGLFEKEDDSKIKYAELQYEAGSGAWFAHTIYESCEESRLSRDNMLNGWLHVLEDEAPKYALDSDEKLLWYPNEEQNEEQKLHDNNDKLSNEEKNLSENIFNIIKPFVKSKSITNIWFYGEDSNGLLTANFWYLNSENALVLFSQHIDDDKAFDAVVSEV